MVWFYLSDALRAPILAGRRAGVSFVAARDRPAGGDGAGGGGLGAEHGRGVKGMTFTIHRRSSSPLINNRR